MEGTIICVTWTLWLVAASALIITLVGHYYQIAIMTGCGCPLVHPAGDRGDHDQPPLQQVHDPVPDTGVQILRNSGIPGYPFSAMR